MKASNLEMTDQNVWPSKLKVAWLFNSLGAGTSLLYWAKILPRVIERFPSSSFMCARPPSRQIPGTEHWVRCVGSLRIPLGPRRNSIGRQLVVTSPTIVSKIRSEQPDVVVILELLGFAVCVAAFRRWLAGASVLALIESDPYHGSRTPNRFTVWVRRQICRRIDLFLTNNEVGKRYLVNELRVDPSKIMATPFLVSEMADGDSATATPRDAPKTDGNQLVFLCVLRLIPLKGIRELIESVTLLTEDTLRQMKIILVGDGPLRSSLQEQVETLGLADVVEFAGAQPHDELAAIYGNADVFLMPTLNDYRALVGFEAISMGLPVLHSIYDGACDEVVSEGKNGFRYDPRNPTEAAEKIRWFVDNRHQLVAFANESREISRKYSVDSAVAGLSDAILRCHHQRVSP